MHELMGIGVLAGGFGLGALKLRGIRAEYLRRKNRSIERAEAMRLSDCDAVLRFLLEQAGPAVKTAVGRSELERWIDSGIAPDVLAERVALRLFDVPGLELGEHELESGPLPVKLPERLRQRHMYVVGKSGSGKTTLLQNLILQDLKAGHGLAVLAPEQEFLTEELLPFIPEDRMEDVIYVNPGDTERPVVLNPLHVDQGEDLDLKVDETLTVLHRVFAEDGVGAAPRMEAILRHALYALMQVPGATLVDLQKVLDRGRSEYRQWIVSQCPDEEIRHFWRETYPSYPKDAHLPLTNRLSRFLRPKVVRSFLATPGPSLNIRQAMDSGKILCFNLADGTLGESNARLLGQLIVAKLQLAAMSRADTPKENRRPFYIYLDEFQSFVNVATTSYERLLSRSRKFNVGLVLAHQQLGQVPEKLMREILGNVATIVSFQLGSTDARRLCRELSVAPVVSEPVKLRPTDFLSLGVGEAIAKIDRSVMPIRTRLIKERGSAEVLEAVIQSSREKYGVSDARDASVGPEDPLILGSDPEDVFD